MSDQDQIRTDWELELITEHEKAQNFEAYVWELVRQQTELLLTKHADYGPRNISDAPGGALNGLRVRMHDKIARINHLIDRGQTANFESLEDSFRDLANYALIAVLVLEGKWPN